MREMWEIQHLLRIVAWCILNGCVHSERKLWQKTTWLKHQSSLLGGRAQDSELKPQGGLREALHDI